MPYVGTRVAASTARSFQAAGPPNCMYGVRMSWVVGQNDGRMYAAVSPASSVTYSLRSCALLRQV